MGLLSWIRFKRLKREDVIESIVKLEKDQEAIEDKVYDMQEEVDDLMKRGKKEKDHDMKLYYARKINYLKDQKQKELKRGMYITYNLTLLNKLKDAMEDKNFYANSGKVPMNKLLSDQVGLAKYLNKALNTRVKQEEILTNADETFNEVQMQYEENETIYGASKSEDQLLAMFEASDAADDEAEIQEIENDGKAGLYSSKSNKEAEEL